MTASATVNKDFKVKHGLNVALTGTFGGTVTVATPTENTHAATKLYVDSAVGSPTIPFPPIESPKTIEKPTMIQSTKTIASAPNDIIIIFRTLFTRTIPP